MFQKKDPQFYDVILKSLSELGNETRHLDLQYEPGKGMDFVPGQFVSIIYPKDGKVIRRAYSIASAPEEKEHLVLLIKLVQGGAVTTWFWTLKPGDKIKIHGPFGKFVLPEKIDFDIVFVATGTGVAPFRSMIHSLLRREFQGKLSLLFGNRYDGMIPYHQEWLDLARKHPQFTYIPTVSRPSPEWKGETGYVQTKINKFFPHPEGKRIYICGLNEMIQAVQETCLNQGYRQDQVTFEKYD